MIIEGLRRSCGDVFWWLACLDTADAVFTQASNWNMHPLPLCMSLSSWLAGVQHHHQATGHFNHVTVRPLGSTRLLVVCSASSNGGSWKEGPWRPDAAWWQQLHLDSLTGPCYLPPSPPFSRCPLTPPSCLPFSLRLQPLCIVWRQKHHSG